MHAGKVSRSIARETCSELWRVDSSRAHAGCLSSKGHGGAYLALTEDAEAEERSYREPATEQAWISTGPEAPPRDIPVRPGLCRPNLDMYKTGQAWPKPDMSEADTFRRTAPRSPRARGAARSLGPAKAATGRLPPLHSARQAPTRRNLEEVEADLEMWKQRMAESAAPRTLVKFWLLSDASDVDLEQGAADRPPAPLLQDGAVAEALQALDELWSGSDSAPALASYQHLLRSASNVSVRGEYDAVRSDRRRRGAVMANPSSPALQIVGMFDSGTNLLGALLQANLGEGTMKEVCPGSDSEGYHCFFWKHSPPQQLARELGTLQRKRRSTVLVAMVRSPLAHLVSWVKAPYELDKCVKSTKFEHDEKANCAIRGEPFSGLTGVWNSYLREYDGRHDASGSSHPVIVVEYERLVIEPEAVVREIAAALGVKVHSTMRTLEAPAKQHGSPHGREKALQDLAEAAWLQKYPVSNKTIRSSLCKNLDALAMRRHAVPTAPKQSLYMHDCA
ncbi:unnamed protein product [Prorocentrum cordatum]|uniref:Sulfotransferase n=1 Tax=Prorocentrum cordatum TaxID=2364126 RepID=A0ABN9WI34_9DINO|nr:unnamed protein product [Polarella glacialis]